LQGFFQNHYVEAVVGKPAQPFSEICLKDRNSPHCGGQDGARIDFNTLAAHLAFTLQTIEQLAIATAQVKDACAWPDLTCDDFVLPSGLGTGVDGCVAVSGTCDLNHLGHTPFKQTREQSVDIALGYQAGVNAGIIRKRHAVLAGKKAVHYAGYGFGFEEKRVVSMARRQISVGDLLATLDEGQGQLAAGFGWAEPIRIEGRDEDAGLYASAGFGDVTATPDRCIVVVHGTCEIEVTVGIEALDEPSALLGQEF
jgi:hypothetical protein